MDVRFTPAGPPAATRRRTAPGSGRGQEPSAQAGVSAVCDRFLYKIKSDDRADVILQKDPWNSPLVVLSQAIGRHFDPSDASYSKWLLGLLPLR
jgi:hypothetical protein